MSDLKLSLVLQAVDRITAPVRQAGKSIKGLSTDADKLDRAIQANIAHRNQLKSQILETGALALALAAPIKAAVDFESAMADVRKVVDFKTPDGLEKLGNAVKEMSREIPIGAAGIAAIVASGGQLGIAEDKLTGFARTAAKMSVAFDIVPEAAGDAMAKLSNVFEMPIENVGRLGDAINHLSDNTAAKAPEMLTTLLRIGGTSRAFGLSAEQASALSNAFISLGKTPEVAATAINAMLTKMQTASTQGEKFKFVLGRLGMSAEELEKAIGQDAQGALTGFLEKLGELDKQTRTKAVSLLFGQEYADDVSLLVGSLGRYRTALGLVADETRYAGSMTTEFENRSKTTKNNLQLLGNSVYEIGINIGTTLLPGVNALADALRGVTGFVADLAVEFPVATQALSVLVAGLIGAKVAALGFGLASTFIKGGVLSLIAGVGSLRGALVALRAVAAANPIGLLLTAASLVVAYWEPIVALFEKIIGYVKDIGSKILPDWIKSAFGMDGAGSAAPTSGGRAAPAIAYGSGSSLPTIARDGTRRENVNVGGELKIRIDAEGRPQVRELRSNSNNMEMTVDTGLAMAMP